MIHKPAHSRRGASGAYRWMTCPSSPIMEDQFANEDSPFSAEGTLAHSLAAACLTNPDHQSIDYLFWDQNNFNVLEEMEQ